MCCGNFFTASYDFNWTAPEWLANTLDTAKRRRKKGFDTGKGFTRFFDSNKFEDMLPRDDLIGDEGMMQDY
jgi:hypothetical protein